MKNLSLLLLCIIFFAGCSKKRPNVIEHPVFDVWNSTTIEIEKIEMSDSATIFSIHAYFPPHNWIRIDKETYIRESGSEEKLPVTGSEGINLGEEFYMPDSGETAFKLFFPPLKPEVTKVDFIESDCERCFKIFGIHLLPDDTVDIAPVPAVTAEELPTLAFSSQPARINGQILGYTKGVLRSNEVSIYYTDPLTLDDKNITLPIADDGSFSGEAFIGISRITYTSLGNVFLTPGKETKITFDLKKRSRYESRLRTDKAPDDEISMYQSGGGLSCEDIDDIVGITESPLIERGKLYAAIAEMTPDAYKKYLLGVVNAKLDSIKQSGKSEKVRILMGSAVKLEVPEYLKKYEWITITKGEWVTSYKNPYKLGKPDEDYYSLPSGILDDHISYLPDYPNITRAIFPLDKEMTLSAKDKFVYLKDNYAHRLGTGHSILIDLLQAQLYGQTLQDMKFYTDAEKAEIKTAFAQHPEYGEALIAENDRLEKLMEDNRKNSAIVINEAPNVPEAKLFDTIIAKYKGKVVLVDFWATWCVPCMQAMKEILPLKEELKGKDVVFLYITNETSPLGKWNLTIPTIHGEHYRLNGDQWIYLKKTFEMRGIPTYLIYDKQGKQTFKAIGFPGVETVKKEIEAAR
jgi:thiol-disulfide isomerase/thioredoxin